MNRALLVDLTTRESSTIVIDGLSGIRERFPKVDVKGKTLSSLGNDVYLRKWTACDQLGERGIAIYDCYDAATMRPVDLPISAKAALEVAI